MKANNEIRKVAKDHGIKHWEIAMRLGISEQTLMRWLRTPLSIEKESAITAAINELAKEGNK